MSIGGAGGSIGGAGVWPPTAVASVTVAAQTDRTVLTAHTLTATLGNGATSVAWTSSTGTFDSAVSLTPTYTPTTIGHQEVVCTPSGPLGAGAPAREAWDVSRPVPVVSSTLGATEELSGAAYAPTLSETAGADAPATPWLTTALLVSDGSSVSVTGSTTTTPSIGSIAVGAAYVVEHTYTDAYGRVGRLSVGVRRTPNTQTSATITTGAPAQQSSISGIALALTLVGTASSYAWGARLTSAGTGGAWATTGFSSSTSATPTYTRPTDDDYEIRCVVTMSDGSTPEARSTVTSSNSVGGGPTWTVVQDTDWTSCTTVSRTSAGTLNVYEQDGITLKSAVVVGTTSSPVGSIACTDGVGLTSTFTSGSGAFFAHAPIGTPSSATKKIALQSIVLVSSLSTDDKACGAANGTNPASGTQNFCVFDTSGANNQVTVVNRVGGSPTTALALSTASSLGTYVCVTMINDMKQQTIYVNTASSASDFTPMTALTGGTNIVPRYDASSAGTTPATYARTYASVYQFLYAAAGGTATCTGTRLLEAIAES